MVYFIQCNEYIKIGYSGYPQARLRQLQSHNPYPLILYGVIEGTESTEHAIHKKLHYKRHTGEWFMFDDHVKNEIDILISNNSISDMINKTDIKIPKYIEITYFPSRK